LKESQSEFHKMLKKKVDGDYSGDDSIELAPEA
jgi:hypothetical protein